SVRPPVLTRRLLSRENGKPVLKPNRPLILKDSVGNRKPRKGEASCVTEMSLLMACWKQNNFVDSLCSNEINTFYTCVHKAERQKLLSGELIENCIYTQTSFFQLIKSLRP
uniref:Coiled-coil-helix-coiled-coil-helix domain containing 1 n=1 Tax=Poecilia latipinna TaxID=48699 RepID=A0A3B3TM34_9TELE